MSRHNIALIFIFLYSLILHAQDNSTVNLEFSTQGYETNSVTPLSDTIPTIKADMNVTQTGALSYDIPIEVFKGINAFQPNLALQYSSQSGNGIAGWGWNILGLSTITQGGKSKLIDGITIGPQFDQNDPFYLDGQRLLTENNIDFTTEKYSKIKITKQFGTTYSFLVQFTDGKVAYYNELAPGQHYIIKMKDASDNEIHYSYSNVANTNYLSSVSYGGADVSSDTFRIQFNYSDREIPVRIFRHGTMFTNGKILSEIIVSSSFLSVNNGIYRKYALQHDLIQNNSVERLIRVDLENEYGEFLKPLTFGYNSATSGSAGFNSTRIPKPSLVTVGLGSVAVGDFHGTGKPYPIYESVGDGDVYKLYDPKIGQIASYNKSRQLFSVRSLHNNKITPRDQLVSLNIDYEESGYDQLTFRFHGDFSRTITCTLLGDFYINSENGSSERRESRQIITGDFNNDGLTDLLIFQPQGYDFDGKFYFIEIGKATSGNITPTEVTMQGYIYEDIGDIYQVEFDGDGIPEILIVTDSGKLSVHKLNTQTNTLELKLLRPDLLLNYTERTPIIFGDFNGDGLTDFITPQKIYDPLESSMAKVVKDMDHDQQLWWEYISTGTNYTRYQKDYTQQRLAYIVPSQRNVIKESSDWAKFWSGQPDTYEFTEYGTSSIIPMDINGDGKTDLISFKKFGTVKYENDLWTSKVFNLNSFLVDGFTYNPIAANKVYFHIAKTLEDGTPTFENLTSTISLAQRVISPLSLVLSMSDYNGLNGYKSEIIIHDPLTRWDQKLTINNDEFLEGFLQEVNNGSPVIQKIEYRPMAEINNDDIESIYTTSDLGLNYPLYIHKNLGVQYLTSKTHTLFDDKILTQEYRYHNGIQHLDGKGFLGFQKTSHSDTYESVFDNGRYRMKDLFTGIFWRTSTYDPLMDNALVTTSYGSLNPGFVFSRTTYTNDRFNKGNSYLVLNTVEETHDYLKDNWVSKTMNYDINGDMLLQKTTTNYHNEGGLIENYEYTPEFENGEHYFFGAIKSVENISYTDDDLYSTKIENTYDSAGKLIESKKYGNNTPAITSEYSYYPFGGVSEVTVNSPDLTAPFVTAYEYDATHRYIWKTTAPNGLITVNTISPSGLLLSEENGLGHITSYQYDHWGNLKKTTDYLGNDTHIYKESDEVGFYSLRTNVEGGDEIAVKFDMFNRQVETKTKSLNDQWVYTRTVYDIFGNKIKESIPFYEGESILWNSTEYDDLNRPIKHTAFNGKVTETCYEGLKITVEDGHKKASKWLDAKGQVVKHQDAGGIINYKYYPNGALKETDYEGIKTRIEIDGWGNKSKLIDPSAGTYIYEYDNLSRIKKETNPKGGITQYTYDALGRLSSENTTSASENTTIVKNSYYDPATHLPTVITGTYNDRPYTYTTYYDDVNFLPIGKKEETPEFTYEVNVSYDSFGRVDVTSTSTTLNSPNYTTSAEVKNIYDANGILTQQIDNQNSQLIWQLNALNSQGLVTQIEQGNGFVENTTYNTQSLVLEKIFHAKDTISVVDIDFNYDVQRGVLLSRNNNIFAKDENYTYDDLDRLLTETVNGVIAQEYTYDQRGRMTSNSSIGKYNYNEQDYQLESVNFNERGNDINTQRGFVEVQYNSFKSPNEIALEGKDRISFKHGILKNRSASYYGSLSTSETERPNRKLYSADNSIEVITEGDTTKVITYMTGDAYSANFMKIDLLLGGSLDSANKYYLHRDSQQTILAITSAASAATVIEKRYFDAWGNLKEAVIAGNLQMPDTLGWVPGLLIDRGYTGHEHLKTVGLVHMNGRIYDPELRRFMSPDNYVQDPHNTQNYNRYGYVWNNPLLYIDPSGEEGITFGVAVAIAAAVAIVVNSVGNISRGVPFWHGMGKSAVMGAVSGAITFGIGSVATSAYTSTISQAAFQAGAHGVVGGVMSVANDGSFLSGFASGAVSSLVGSSIGISGINKSMSKGLYKATLVAAGGLSGGASSAIAGGDFWQGAKQGIIVSGLNHLAHHIYDTQQNSHNRYRAKELIKEYGYGNVDDIASWLDKHPFEEHDGKVYFKGIYDFYVDISGGGITLADAIDWGTQYVAEEAGTRILSLFISKGAGMLLNDGGLAKSQTPMADQQAHSMRIANAGEKLIQYMFTPTGPRQIPSMLNNFVPYSGLSRYQLGYRLK